jgi:hypothetical protein
MKLKVRWEEKSAYCLYCLLTFGMFYILKCTIKIALAELENSKESK